MVEFVWPSDKTTKHLDDEQQAFCTAVVTKLEIYLKNLVAKCFYSCRANQNGHSLELYWPTLLNVTGGREEAIYLAFFPDWL